MCIYPIGSTYKSDDRSRSRKLPNTKLVFFLFKLLLFFSDKIVLTICHYLQRARAHTHCT